MTILIADDNETNRKLLRFLLEGEGHTVIEAENGVAALKALEQTNVDAIVSDILMPEMDGFRLCHEIRKHPKHRKLPFIVHTASYTSPSDENVAVQFGVDGFIRKPASTDEIVKTFHKIVESANNRRRVDVKIPEEVSVMREYSQVLVRKLEQKIVELSDANSALAERTLLAEFATTVSTAISQRMGLKEMLRLCCDAMVEHLGAAFARIWTLNEKEQVLELQASSGMYTHIDGGHARVPVGRFKIGLIASEHKPHLTNTVVGDPRVGDQEWAKREGMIAFAGYPLMIADQLVGVMAAFARKPFSQNTLDAMGSVAQNIAVSIQREIAEGELRQSEERFRELAENVNEIFYIADPQGRKVHYVSPAHEQITGQKCSAVYQNPRAWTELIHPDDRLRVEESLRINTPGSEQEYRIVRPDGELRWLRSRSFPIKDEDGIVARIVGIATDITERKQAEVKINQNLSRIRGLHEIGVAINSTLDIDTVLQVLLEKIDLFIPYPSVTTVRLLNQETGQFEFLACRNISVEEWKSEFVVGSRGRARRVLETRTPITARNLLTDPSTHNPSFYSRHGLVSYACLPLIVRDEALGIFNLYTKEEHEFTNEEVELLMTLAGQAAIAINNARLYESAQRQLKRIQGVSEINNAITSTLSLKNVLEVLLEKIELVCPVAVACGARLFDEATGNMVPLASRHLPFEEWKQEIANAKGRLTDLLIKTKKPVAILNMQKDSRTSLNNFTRKHGLVSYLGVPLVVREKFIGNLVIYTKAEHAFSAEEIEIFTSLGSQAAIAIHNAQLYEETRAREAQLHDSNRMLSALHSVGTATSRSLDLDVILKSAIERIREIFGFDATHIHIFDPQTDDLTLRAYFETDPARFTTARSFKKGQGIVGRVAESGEALIFDDVQTDPRYRQMSRSKTSGHHGYHFFAVLPIKGRRETFGTLACVGNDLRKLSAAEIQMLEAITGQIAVALENSTLYENVREKVDELQQVNTALQDTNRMLSALHAVAAAANQSLDLNHILQAAIGKIMEIFDFDATRIHLLDESSGQLVHQASFEKHPERFTSVTTFQLGQGVIGKVAQSGQPLVFENIENDPTYRQLTQTKRTEKFKDRFFAVFPIRSKSGTTGTLGCIGHEARKLRVAEFQLLEAIADQIAVAIENARLFEKNELAKQELAATNRILEQSLNKLGSLYTAMTPLALAESLGDMLNGIVERLMETTGADAAFIEIWDHEGDGHPLIGHRGYTEEFITQVRRRQLGGAIDWVVRNGEPIIAPEIAAEARMRGKRQLEMGLHSCTILPLRVHGEILGVIQLSSRTPRYFDEEQRDHLMTVARQMSISLENRDLFYNLQASRNELERANKVKGEFLSVMSHELRTPLSIVIGYSGMLREEKLGPLTQDQAQGLGVIQRNSKELFAMIESIMDATKIDAGSIIAEKDAVLPWELLGELKVAYDFPTGKDIRFEWNFSEALPVIWTDLRKLRQVLTNLINNAIKFTDRGTIVISAEEKIEAGEDSGGRWIEFRVSDSGIGIAPAETEKIFERFYQVDSSETRSFEGVGLGLHIAKSFTDTLGGRISVSSEVGKGSTFTVCLPVTTTV